MKIPTPETDPSTLVGLVGAAVGAILTAVVAFGVELTADQITAILGVVSTVGALTVALAIRLKAWAPASHDLEVGRAFDRGLMVGRQDLSALEASDDL